MTRLLLAALACTFACSSSPPSPAAPDWDAQTAQTDASSQDAGLQVDPLCVAFAANIQESVDAERTKQKVQHAAVAVATPRCGKTLVFSDDANAAVKVTPDMLWQLGSVTKTFVAATVLRLVEVGKVGLEDPLSKFLPDFPNAGGILLRHLLSHTSGVFEYLRATELSESFARSPSTPRTADEILAIAAKYPPTFAPGKGWGYSNTNFVILGRVIEVATGAGLGSQVRAQAIERAKLEHTFFASVETPVGDPVPGFEGGKDVTRVYNPTWWGAAGAMQSTPRDVLDWLMALYGADSVLSPGSRAQMSATLATDSSSLRYGLGLMEWNAAKTDGNGIGYGHTGSVPGYQTEILFHPQTNVAVAAFASDSKGAPHKLVEAVYKALRSLE